MTTTTELKPAAAETCAPDPHVWVAHMRGGEPIHVEICMGCGQFNWGGLREQVAALIAAANDHPEHTCGRCGGPNVPWSAPSPLWNQVMRGGDINATDLEKHHGIVCPTCFAVLAQQAGIADLWQMSAQRVHVPLQTVTPSGRTWNEQTWLWDDAPAQS